MTSGNGYRAQYDYVELSVKRRDNHWSLILTDPKHNETIEYEEKFQTAHQAQDAAMPFARRHIYELHNDTLLARNELSWTEY
jgi:hypothetical protein